MRFIGVCLVLLISSVSWAQDLTVPEEILDELKTVEITIDTDTFTFRVAYPLNYDQSKTYKCFIGLSGGDQSLKVVDYCYAAWFRSGYFEQYITIMPVVKTDSVNFRDYSPERIERMLDAINKNFKVTPGWLIGGTSNGGVAAFNFVAAFPDRFEGIITAPGTLDASITPTEEWNHLKVILAYGDSDSKIWIKAVKETAKRLKNNVTSVTLVPLQDQGHILSIKFNADKMYDPYFLPKN